MLASATAVELLASVLQQPQKGLTPPSQQDNTEQGPLSTVPHQIRGFLGNFDTMKIWGPSYPSCSACSPNITKAWREQGWEFVKQALNTPDIINDISGLSEVQKRAEELLDDNWDSSTASEGELI
jgi:ubiquitin-like modifier-activating enzyme ATG7